MNETVVYIGGMYPDYTAKEGRVISRTKQQGEFYRVKFSDGQYYMITVKALRKKNEQLTLQFS